MLKKLMGIALAISLFLSAGAQAQLPPLKISANHRYFTANGKPFFWLGDTGWLLLSKLKQADAAKYLDIRARQGYNVIQIMVIHSLNDKDAYGTLALNAKNIASPKTTPGNTLGKDDEYDYWDNLDWVVTEAAKKGLYVALVPVWGSVVKEGHIGPVAAKQYAGFLGERYKGRTNVIWMNGGDIAGSDSAATWKAIGSTLHALNPDYLITYHPRGRTQSSTWFHNEDWLSFNAFQSGHRTYAQDTSKGDLHYGEDNWRYVAVDYNKQPVKPTLDAEPSYERIPYGLHDFKLPKWNADDVRRYAYWSVFAGGCGFTYGNNDVMQMHRPEDEKVGAYGSTEMWYNSINDAGAVQMKYLKELMLSRSYFDRVPDQSLIAVQPGEKYDHQVATRGDKYVLVYTYTGKVIKLNADKLNGSKYKARWFDPRTGKYTAIGTFTKNTLPAFNPPGTPKAGNDWVLVLDAI